MFVNGEGVPKVSCEPGVTRKVLAYNEGIMMCEITFRKGAKGNVHAHPHVQVTYVAKGSFAFTIGTETKTVKQGDSVLIPGGASHGVEALEEGMLIDVFSPMRKEFV